MIGYRSWEWNCKDSIAPAWPLDIEHCIDDVTKLCCDNLFAVIDIERVSCLLMKFLSNAIDRWRHETNSDVPPINCYNIINK